MPGSGEVTFESLLEAAPDAMVGVGQDGVIRFVNRHSELLFGYDRNDLVGQTIEVLVPQSKDTAHLALRSEYTQGPETRAMGTGLGLTGRRRDGTEFSVDISLSHLDSGKDGPMVLATVRDTTERMKALEERNRTDWLAAMVESSGEAIIGQALDGRVTSWNPAAQRLYGYSSEEMIGKSAKLLTPQDRTSEFITLLDKIKDGQAFEHLETVLVRKDRKVIPVSLTISPILDAHGATIGASTIARDLSADNQAFEAARSMIESSLDSLVAISPEGMITDVNEATVKVTGIARVELIGTAFSECFTEPEKAKAIYEMVFEQGMAVDYPLTMRHRDGTLTAVLYNASVYRDADGRVLGVFAAARDVTKQRQAGAQYTRSLIEAALDPLVMISPEGKITDVNEATAKVTGIPREELIGTDFSDYFTQPDKANESYQQVFALGSVTDYPLTLRSRNGTLTDVLYNASVYRDEAGKVLGVFAAARDVTEQQMAQAELAKAAKELDRLAELERFQRMTIGRELKMIELKKEIEYLKKFHLADGGESGDQY